jgi:hypothetical protein
MAVVYRARYDAGTPVAIKLLRETYSRSEEFAKI